MDDSGGIVIASVGDCIGDNSMAYFYERKVRRKLVDYVMLQVILDNIPCQVLIKDVVDDFRYKIANKNFFDYYHLKSENVIGKTDFEIFEPNLAKQLRSHDMLVVSHQGESFRFNEDISFQRTGNEVFKSLKTCFLTSEKASLFVGGLCRYNRFIYNAKEII